MPLLWTGASYGLMGIVNPVLRGGVDWPWFIVSQFVFGVVCRARGHAGQAAPPAQAGLAGRHGRRRC